MSRAQNKPSRTVPNWVCPSGSWWLVGRKRILLYQGPWSYMHAINFNIQQHPERDTPISYTPVLLLGYDYVVCRKLSTRRSETFYWQLIKSEFYSFIFNLSCYFAEIDLYLLWSTTTKGVTHFGMCVDTWKPPSPYRYFYYLTMVGWSVINLTLIYCL